VQCRCHQGPGPFLDLAAGGFARPSRVANVCVWGMGRSHGPHRVSGTTKTVSKPTQRRRHAPHPSYLGAQVAIRIDDIAAETTTATPQMAIRIARRNSSPKATRGREWHVAKQPTKTWGRTMDRLYGPRLVAKNDRMQGRSGPIQLRK